MGIEFELKYAATPSVQAAIRAQLGEKFHPFSMETTYYDTPSGDLSARRWTLRRRKENGVSVCTLKTPGQNGARGEWDCECGSIEEAIPVLCKLSSQNDLSKLAAEGLVPICGARFIRLAYTIETDEAVLEAALDSGVLTGGGKEDALCEVEVELKSGSRQEAVRFAAELAEKFGLTPEPKSKFRRALDLIQQA